MSATNDAVAPPPPEEILARTIFQPMANGDLDL